MKSSADLRASAQRELALRKRVYWAWVNSKKLTADQARHEIQCMEDIVRILHDVAAWGQYAPPQQMTLPGM